MYYIIIAIWVIICLARWMLKPGERAKLKEILS